MFASIHTGYYLTQNAQIFSKKGEMPIKITRHNGRSGKHGTYNPKHNDRKFNIENSEHIDPKRVNKNIYWDVARGFTSAMIDEENPDYTFEEIEHAYYYRHYSEFIYNQNARNEKNRHPERNRTVEDLLANNKTCPEETIFQIGTIEESVSAETLIKVVSEFCNEFEKRFGSHVHILDWALHLDEGTPHIHERHVFDCENKYGELCPQQEKALEELGISLPDSDKPKGKNNNRKQTFDAVCRTMLFDIAKKHNIIFDEEPTYGGRAYLEKQDYILMKQKEMLASQKQALDELSLKIEDVENLIDSVSEIAYDKAVEIVSDTVREETQKEDISAIEGYRRWIISPERTEPAEKRRFVANHLGRLISAITKGANKIASKIQKILMKPEVRKENTDKIKSQVRVPIMEKLNQKQNIIKAADERKTEPSVKQEIE